MDKRNLFTETLTAQKMRDRLETKLLSLRKQRQFDFLMKKRLTRSLPRSQFTLTNSYEKFIDLLSQSSIDEKIKILSNKDFISAIKENKFELPKSKSAKDLFEFIDSKELEGIQSFKCKFCKNDISLMPFVCDLRNENKKFSNLYFCDVICAKLYSLDNNLNIESFDKQKYDDNFWYDFRYFSIRICCIFCV